MSKAFRNLVEWWTDHFLTFMKKHLLLCAFVLSVFWVRADFVDVATISVNGKMVRKLTNNSRDLYLINFDNYHRGDTVNVDIWTDYGGENHSFVTLQNVLNSKTDTLSKKNQFILTEEIKSNEFLISVTFVDPFGSNHGYTWNICKIVPDHRIEVVYESINELKELLVSLNTKKSQISSTVLTDSLTVNFKPAQSGNEMRQLSDTVNYSISKLSGILQFNKTEMSYLKHYNAVDYADQYDFETNLHGSIQVAENSIDHFSVSFGNFTYRWLFNFQWDSEKYILESIFYHVR